MERHSLVQGALVGVVFVTLAAGPVVASAQGWYAGASIGQATVKEDLGCDLVSGLGVACSEDDSDTALKLFAGYEINPNVGIEFAYIDLGQAKLDAFDGIDSLNIEWETSGLNVAVVGALPVSNQFTVTGKVGLFRWDVDADVGGTLITESDSESGTDLMFGLGLKYDVTNNVSVRAEWERFTDVGDDNTTGQSDVDFLSVGILFKLK